MSAPDGAALGTTGISAVRACLGPAVCCATARRWWAVAWPAGPTAPRDWSTDSPNMPISLQGKMKEMLCAAGFRTAEVLPEFQHPLNR